jgi:hypothetical protein
MRPPSLSEDALKVLRVARERALDGYSLMSKTGLDPQKLYAALRELVDEDLVSMRGDLTPDLIGDVYLVVPPTAFAYADLLLGDLRFKRAT